MNNESWQVLFICCAAVFIITSFASCEATKSTTRYENSRIESVSNIAATHTGLKATNCKECHNRR